MDSYYAINEDNKIYYWGYVYNNSKPALSSFEGNSIIGNTITTPDAKHNATSLLSRVKTEYNVIFEEGYCEWIVGKRKQYVLHLQKDGFLMRYKIIPDSKNDKGYRLIEPMQIGQEKLNLDYFQ